MPLDIFLDFCWSVLAVLSPGLGPVSAAWPVSDSVLGSVLGPGRPNFQSYLDFTTSQPVGTVPGPVRPFSEWFWTDCHPRAHMFGTHQ